MDSVLQLTTRIWLSLLVPVWLTGCASERIVAREVLADPLMRFSPGRTVQAPMGVTHPSTEPLPTDTIKARVEAIADPGSQIQGTWLASNIRTAVELVAGFGLEAGYGLTFERERLWRLDGFSGPIDFERMRHGPDAALVYDDGTSLIRAGYGYRTAFDGDLHEPTISARSLILGSDTVVGLAYRRTMAEIQLGPTDLPAGDSIDSHRTADLVSGSIEQGFLPGINLRLEMTGLIESGFLQNPYRLVTLWSHRPENARPGFDSAPQSEPESHPDSRTRWGGLARVRFAIPALASVLEMGAGHGSGSWRVEHTQSQVAWLQRLGQRFSFELRGGIYHQTRAFFYRDDYNEGPPGSYWSADRDLCSYVAWWSQLGLSLLLIPERGRLMGMFNHLSLELGGRVVQADLNWEGLDSQNGFSEYADLSGTGGRRPFAGGWQFGGWFNLVAGF